MDLGRVMLVDCNCDEEPSQPGPCPVEALSRQADELIKAYGAADRAALTNVGSAGTELALWADRIARNLDAVEAQACQIRATSGRGALFQIHILAMLADRIASWPHEGTPEYRANQKDLKVMLRLLYSIGDVVETATGVSPERACRDYYMPHRMNPHIPLANEEAAKSFGAALLISKN